MLSKFSNIVLNLNQASREQPINKFQDAAFELIKSVVPFDSALWLTGTLDFEKSEATFHTFHLHNQPPQILVDWSQVKEERAVFSKKVFTSPGITHNCVTSKHLGPELLQHARRYNVEHILATTIVDPVTSLNELISIYRADVDQPFTEEERLFQQNIVPLLAETWRTNRILNLAYANQASFATKAHSATADTKGVLHLADPDFTRLLQGEWPDWRGPRLPDELATEFRNQGQRFMGKTMVVKISDLHGQFLLRGRKRSGVDSLSQREHEVAQFFSEGLSNKAELANSLKEAA